MAKIDDLLNLDFDKISSEPLKKAIEDFNSDYKAESDKEGFVKAHTENIKKLYGMVERHAPEAIRKAEKKPEKKEPKPKTESKSKSDKKPGLNKELVILIIGELKAIGDEAEETGTGDVVGIMINTSDALEKALEEGDEKKLEEEIKKALQPYISWEGTIEKNQEMRHGYVDQEDKELRDKAAKSVNKLLKELGMETMQTNGSPKKKSEPKGQPKKEAEESQAVILTKELVREVIDELTDVGIDLDGEDETIIATTRMDLEEALEETEQSKFRKKVAEAVESFKDFVKDISDEKVRKAAIISINKLLNALGETLLKTDGKEKKESEEERSKRILEELEELKPELERCRAVVSEANRKKREAQGSKPKPTRFTQLKTKLLSLAKLIPPHLKDNLDVQKKTEKVLLTAHRELVSAWGMDKVKAKPGAKAIKEEFDKMEEKVEKQKNSKK